LIKETRDVDTGINTAFDVLRKDTKEHIKILKSASLRRGLTREEEKILRDLMDNFDEVEKFLKKEIGDVRKILEK
jgi:hypothetical protein